ncbi:amino acid permease [Sphingomonas lutea]|uniref:Amino acid permease n=1 Tax=Sphingomonas lutea TaxID=1045317 RepID=A0A7G9SHN9_9SPHN|nr:APC family permease [Sphingomonas lutea]QNN67364.1 amino acid permease [Sphingomonas lutea]
MNDTPPRLERRIGLGGAVMLSFNGAVGAAIFALPATLAADFGAFSPWLFPLIAIGAMLVIWPFSRSVAAFPESGGPATYGRAFGRFAGFELGWIFYVARAAAFAANANVLIAYLGRWVPAVEQGVIRASILAVVTLGLAIANLVGVERALRLLAGLTLLKALPLLIAALAALVLFAPIPAPGAPPALSEFEAGALLVFYAFVGFENLVVPAGETKQPATTLPRAILLSILVTTTLYFLVQLAFVTMFPTGGADADAPLIDLGRRLAGPAGAAILMVAAISSLGGNLHGIMAAVPRVTSAMGERGDLPAWFARVQRKYQTPANSILFFALFAGTLAVSGSFVWLAVVSTLARMIIYAVTIAALPRAPGKPRVTAGHWAIGAAGILVCVWAAAQADAKAWLTLGILSVAGVLLYALATFARGKTP